MGRERERKEKEKKRKKENNPAVLARLIKQLRVNIARAQMAC